MHTCTFTYRHIYTHAHIHACTYIHMHIYIRARIQAPSAVYLGKGLRGLYKAGVGDSPHPVISHTSQIGQLSCPRSSNKTHQRNGPIPHKHCTLDFPSRPPAYKQEPTSFPNQNSHLFLGHHESSTRLIVLASSWRAQPCSSFSDRGQRTATQEYSL